jgi:peptidoglycan/LPS O-acetylase OafA/YrhL
MRQSAHLAALDGLRGIAALTVVFYHILLPLGIYGIARHGYLAVDFFFVLSGFVVAYAYEEKLIKYMRWRDFFLLRMTRLYPLVFAGILLGASVTVGKRLMIGDFDDVAFIVTLFWGLVVLPFGGLTMGSEIAFPLNGPIWSLFYEFMANFVYAAIVKWLSSSLLYCLIAAGFFGICFEVIIKGDLNVGGDLVEFVGGLSRVTFSFFMGVLLYRHRPVSLISGTGALSAIALGGALCIPILPGNGWVELTITTLLFPAIIWQSSRLQVSALATRANLLLGRLSYPIYILHYPILRIFQYGQERFALRGYTLWISVVLEIVVIIGVSYFVLVLYDEPLRRTLANLRAGKTARA